MDLKIEEEDDGSWIPQLINHMTKQDSYEPQIRMFHRLAKVSNGVKGYTERVLQQLEIVLMKEIVKWPLEDKRALIQKCGVYYFAMQTQFSSYREIFVRWIGLHTWGKVRNVPTNRLGSQNHWTVIIGKPPFTLHEWKQDPGKYDAFLRPALDSAWENVINFDANTIIVYHLKEKHNDGSQKLCEYGAELQVVDDEVMNCRLTLNK